MLRVLAQERSRPLVALLLEALRAHGAEEAVGSQWYMGSARGRRWAAVSQATCDTHAASPSRCCGLRPSSLAARIHSRNGRWARCLQRRLANRAGHTQHAAARRAAFLFDGRHRRGVVVIRVVAEMVMTSTEGAE